MRHGAPRIAVPATIGPGGFAGFDRTAAIVTLTGATMGTTWRVLLAAPRRLDQASLRRAIAARLEGLVAEMSHWDEGSLLARFNRAPAATGHLLTPDFAAVIDAALALAETTGGAFDPAIGRLTDLWGFGPAGARPPPEEAALAAACASSGWRRLAWDATTRRLRQPGGLALDLSGIAKGHAVDAITGVLAAWDVRHCLVEVGGELAGRGIRPDGDPWWVELENPPGRHLAPFRIALHELAVATSGDYVRGAHTIDPRTGRAANSGVISASVVAPTARAADGWATALTVLGTGEGAALADRHGIAARIVTAGEEVLTSALRAMLE